MTVTVSMTGRVKATQHPRKLGLRAVWPGRFRTGYTASLMNVALDSAWLPGPCAPA